MFGEEPSKTYGLPAACYWPVAQWIYRECAEVVAVTARCTRMLLCCANRCITATLAAKLLGQLGSEAEMVTVDVAHDTSECQAGKRST